MISEFDSDLIEEQIYTYVTEYEKMFGKYPHNYDEVGYSIIMSIVNDKEKIEQYCKKFNINILNLL